MKITDINRYQAFASHLIISLIIFLVILIYIAQLWYPGILFDTGNGWKAIGLIIGIDLILGPLLTLIIFNPKKSSLKFDLTVIAVIQSLALIYGTWIIQSSRPLAIAYINNSFITFYANAKNAPEVIKKIASLKTNQLYYVFNDSNPSKGLNTNQLFPYQEYEKSVPLINSSFISDSSNSNELVVQIDPLTTTNRYIIINKSSGSIIRFSNGSPDDVDISKKQ
jgi:hypothetical protein